MENQNSQINPRFMDNVEKTAAQLLGAIGNYKELRVQYDSLDLGADFPDVEVIESKGYTGAQLKAVAATFDAVIALLEADGNTHNINLHVVVPVRVR